MIVINIILTFVTSMLILISLIGIKQSEENAELLIFVMIAIYEVAMLLKIWD